MQHSISKWDLNEISTQKHICFDVKKKYIEQQWDKMIITYKIKHNKDFSAELKKAKQIAEFAIKTRSMSSKDVACLG
jgi:transposase